MSNQFKHYARELLNIALPIIMGNLGFIMIGAGLSCSQRIINDGWKMNY